MLVSHAPEFSAPLQVLESLFLQLSFKLPTHNKVESLLHPPLAVPFGLAFLYVYPPIIITEDSNLDSGILSIKSAIRLVLITIRKK